MTMLSYSELHSNRLFSPKLWRGLAPPLTSGPFTAPSGNPAIGVFDDFIGFGGTLSTNTGSYYSGVNRYISYQTASTLLTNVALAAASTAPTSVGAIIFQPTSGVADNDQITLQWGGHELTPYGCFPFSVMPGVSKDLVFECRLKVNSIADSIGDIFIGLGGAAGVALSASAVPITQTASTLATTVDLLGFHKLSGDGDKMDLAYERASGTVATKADVATLVADTYIKLGFRYSGHSKTVSIFVDGAEVVASRIAASVTAATPWPTDYLTPVIATMQVDGTTGMTPTVDWYACAQYL
jgi:hypothetical protein